MEQRTHPRIQLPLLVELQHASLGRRRCTARDVSEGGIFVRITSHQLREGAKIKLTHLNPNQVDNQPTPTVDMEVKRVEDEGVGLAFINRTGRHLWDSVQRMRGELEIGRDYFQVYFSALAMNDRGQVLTVQQHGRWTFPGCYLVVAQQWEDALAKLLKAEFNLEMTRVHRICDMQSSDQGSLPEAAALKIHVLVGVDDAQFKVSGSSYRNYRWIGKRRDIEDTTFADDHERQLVGDALDWFQD